MVSYISSRTSKMQPSILSPIPILCSLLVLQTNFLSSYGLQIWNMTHTKAYPACLGQDDCDKIDNRKMYSKNYHACFQYFCYPWQEEAVTADKTKKPLFKGCRSSKDCTEKGRKGYCFRHHDKRNINRGICMRSRQRTCESHDECTKFGGRCCNGFCCNEIYFSEIKKMPCTTPEGCQDLLAGDQCCIDITGTLGGFSHSQANWEKRCCTNQRGAVILPEKGISDKDRNKINNQITRMPGFEEMICSAFEYDQMIRYSACHKYSTTTPPTTSTTTTTTKVPPRSVTKANTLKGNVNVAASIYDSKTKIGLIIISLNLIMLSF